MLTVLALATFLLVVMPAALLWLGKMIEANTDGRGRRAAKQSSVTTQGEDPDHIPWFRRPMRPAFTKPKAG